MVAIALIVLFVLHPVEFLAALVHCSTCGGKWNVECVDFWYSMWCSKCEKVFLDEVDR